MKTTIIFVHGFKSSSDFANNIFNLENKYNIIAINLPGSKYLDHDECELGIDFFSFLVKTFIKKKVKSYNIILVGHSLGATVIAPLSKLWKVRRLVFISAVNPYMIYSRSWTFLYDFFHGTGFKKNLQNSLIKSGAILYTKFINKNTMINEFLDQQGRFVPIIKNYILNTEYMSEILKQQYLDSLKKKPLFMISQEDKIIDTTHFVNFVEQELKQKPIIISEPYHNPFTKNSQEINQILNQISSSKKRFWPKKLVKD